MYFDDFNFRSIYRKHPLLSRFSDILPKDIGEVFSWVEFIMHNSPIAASGIKKLSEVPITNLRYSTGGDTMESTTINDDSWKSILEESLKMKPELLSISFNTLAYGNAFVSVYAPVNRRAECSKCSSSYGISNLSKVSVKVDKSMGGDPYSHRDPSKESAIERGNGGKKNNSKSSSDDSKKFKKTGRKKSNLIFKAKCPNCKTIEKMEITDLKSSRHQDINIVIWNPKDIKISSNNISGTKSYFYKAPREIKSKIVSGDMEMLATTPLEMMEAALTGKYFKFAKDHIYHIKKDFLAGVSTSWGIPNLASAIPPFLTLMTIRKANEAIASDYMVPLRTVSPASGGSGSDMYNYISGGDFVSKVNTMVATWKADPSGVQVSPVPLQVENILGNGKLLTAYQEADQLENNIAYAMGVPVEFIKGGLSYTAQGTSLRLLENQLAQISSSLDGVLSFVVGRVSNILEKEPIKVSMVPFKIIDDMQEKAAIMQLAMNSDNSVSLSTLLEMFNIDSIAEKRRIVEDQKESAKSDLEIQKFKQEAASSIEEQAENAAQMNKSKFSDLNQQALMEEAQDYAQQLMQMDDGARRSSLDQMSKENYVMYGVVSAIIDMQKQKMAYSAQKQAESNMQE